MRRIIILTMICIFFTTFCIAQDTEIILRQGQPAPYPGYFFSEPQYNKLLILQNDYKVDKQVWDQKEKIYQDAVKEKTNVPFWKSGKFNFFLGIVATLAAAYVLSTVKIGR